MVLKNCSRKVRWGFRYTPHQCNFSLSGWNVTLALFLLQRGNSWLLDINFWSQILVTTFIKMWIVTLGLVILCPMTQMLAPSWQYELYKEFCWHHCTHLTWFFGPTGMSNSVFCSQNMYHLEQFGVKRPGKITLAWMLVGTLVLHEVHNLPSVATTCTFCRSTCYIRTVQWCSRLLYRSAQNLA